MTLAAATKRTGILRIGFRESFTLDSLSAGYAPGYASDRNLAGLELMPSHIADQLIAAWEDHGSRLYVVRSKGIPIAWGCVSCHDSKLTVPVYRYPGQTTFRHQALARKA